MDGADTAGRTGLVRPVPFLRAAIDPLFAGRLAAPVLLLGVLLTVSNMVILLDVPAKGQLPGPGFLAAAFLRVAGLLVMVVGLTRMMAGSQRGPWRPDGAFWLSALSLPLSLGVAFAARRLLGAVNGDPVSLLAPEALAVAVQAPFAAWLTALIVEKPLAWRPAPWFAGMTRWLPAFLLWSLASIPLVVLHATLDFHLVKVRDAWFWPILLLDGPLSLAIALWGICLNVAAYRHVARR